jgi:hypothetical protein
MILEHVLIGGPKDGERVRCEADREYVVFPIVERMAAADFEDRPISIDNFATNFKKAIYTRRRFQVDQFGPLTCLGAIELTNREILALLIGGYRK